MARKKSAAKKAREVAEQSEKSLTTKNVEKPVQVRAKIETQDEPSDSGSGSSDESEDEFGELITEGIEEGINKVLSAIKSNPKSLLDPNVQFFSDPTSSSADKSLKGKGGSDKPIYLKDYHRMNLLSGDYKNDDDDEENEFGTVDGEKPFVVTEREERNQLLSDIKNAFQGDDEDDDDDDGFLTKKAAKSRREVLDESNGSLPDPNKDENEFLSAFVDKKAWIPKENDKVIDLDRVGGGENEDDDEFDDAVEQFEHAYNFRYEDPNAAEIMSYARNQATLRRSATNSRKRQRERENEEREKEEREKQELLKKKKMSKVNEVADRLKKIKEAVGDEVSDDVIQKVFGDSLLNDDFDDTDWDSKMAQIFDEQYYDAEIEKPEWSEDDLEVDEGVDGVEEDEMDAEPPAKKSKKDKLKDKKLEKKEKESIKERAQEIVEANTLRILSDVVEERGRSKKRGTEAEIKFKYREVSPEAFGLTTRDIILADDKLLNNYIGLKKFAPYRAKELRMKDKRKYTKSKNLKEWRKETFGKAKKAPEEVEGDDSIWVPVEGGEDSEAFKSSKDRKKDKKDKKHRKSKK